MPIAFRSSGSSVCSRDWLIRENNHHVCIRGGSVCTPYASGAQIVQHGVHVMMSAKCLKRAHEATRGIVRLRIPSYFMIITMTVCSGGLSVVHVLTCRFDSMTDLRIEPPISLSAVAPPILLVDQPIVEGVHAPRPLAHGSSVLPLRLKLSSVRKVQYTMPVKPCVWVVYGCTVSSYECRSCIYKCTASIRFG